ncbi:MAG: MFS transporter, partial [Chloroflexi bacterium]
MKNSRWLSLIVLCTGFLLIVVDMTIVNVALPSIQKDLGFSASGLAWVINAYLIAFGGLLLLAGRVGDLVGRKKVFLAGLAIFTAASVVCGLSFAQPVLVVARFIQGIGGAVSSAVILAMIVTMFPEPLERAKAFGIFSFVASAGAAVGLIAGGLITQAVSWHWIFFVNLPIGVATAIAAARLIDNDRGIGLGQGADVPGALTVTGALMLGVYTIVQTSDHGLVSTRTLVLALVTGALLAAFVVRQARGRNPILPLRLFRSRLVSGANLAQGLMSISFLGFFFLGSLDMERVLGYGPMALGLAFLPVAIVMALFSIRFSAQLIGRFGPYAMMLCGLLVAGGALVMVAFGPTYPTYALNLMLPMALLGLGGGLCFPALTMLAMADVAPSDAGLASGLLNTTGQVGGAFGLAMLATIAG